jgi:alkylation response protein AidB-like acyl-CoA dehydrogenase
MDLEPTPDQLALVDELRRFLDARVERPAAATPEVWSELDAMGVLSLPVPEDRGGVGLGWAEAALAFQALGRSGVAGPFVATAAASAAGLARGITGLVPEGPRPGPAATPTLVEHLDRLDTLLAVGPTGVRTVPLPLAGARPVARPLDPLTPVHVVETLPPGSAVAGADGARLLARHAALLAAAQQVGLGLAAVSMATAYAGERQQFGRPIGSFQAVKHLLADAIVGVEVARAAVDAAAVTVDEGGDDTVVARAVASARVVASEAAGRATRASIQVHGGMGYTWELDAHLHLKRVLVLDQSLGTVEDAVESLAS